MEIPPAEHSWHGMSSESASTVPMLEEQDFGGFATDKLSQLSQNLHRHRATPSHCLVCDNHLQHVRFPSNNIPPFA
jgi:hypothetical protein